MCNTLRIKFYPPCFELILYLLALLKLRTVEYSKLWDTLEKGIFLTWEEPNRLKNYQMPVVDVVMVMIQIRLKKVNETYFPSLYLFLVTK